MTSNPTPTRNKVIHELKQFILATFLPGEDPAALTESTPLMTSGVLDSIATLRLVAFTEETFGISIAAHEASASFNTIAEIANLIDSKRS
jgi:acyl carrier protein